MVTRLVGILTSVALACAGCGGPLIEAVDGASITADGGDTMPERYYLPKGILKATVTYKADTGFTLAFEKSAVADLERPYYLRFRHDSLGKETATIDVNTETGLLTTVAGNGTEQYKELIEASNAIIKGALDVKNAQPAFVNSTDSKSTKECDGVQAIFTFDIRAHSAKVAGKSIPTQYKSSCTLYGTASVVRDSDAFASPGNTSPKRADAKAQGVVYFRVPAFYTVTMSFGITGAVGAAVPDIPMQVSAPDMTTVGQLAFPRGVFASRGLTATFVNGMLSKQEVSRDSEVIGFLAIPAAGLATAALVKQF